MPKSFPLKRVLAMIASILANTISWVPTMQQAFNNLVVKWVPNIDKTVNWLAIVSSAVFFVFVIWTLWDLSLKLDESEAKKPAISIKPQPLGEMWNLEIINKGERGIFSAEVCIFDNEQATGYWYTALWGNSNTDKSELMSGRRDIIKLATISYTDTNIRYFDIKAYDTNNNCPESVRHIEFDSFEKFMHQQLMQVRITSDPRPIGGPLMKEYILSPNGIIERKPRIRKSEPEHYALGSDMDNSNKSYTIEWVTDIWQKGQESLILSGTIVIKSRKPINVESVNIKIGNDTFASNWKTELYWAGGQNTIFTIPYSITRGKRVATIEYVVEGIKGSSDVFNLDIPRAYHS